VNDESPYFRREPFRSISDERNSLPSDNAPSASTRAVNAGAPDDRFKLTWLHEVVIDFDQQWLVKKLFPRVGVISLYGDSQSFKTFVAIHLCYCVALGKEFAGRKVKIDAPCIYIAAEDSEGVKKRLVAYHMANKDDLPARDQIPIAVMEATPNLGSLKGDLDKLIATVREALMAMGQTHVALIVIDTLSQTLGDAEERTIGMQAFMHNATRLSRYFGCCVVAIHHVGHNEKDRERGGSQIKGNADGRIWVERVETAPMVPIDASKTFEAMLHVMKVKNGPDGFDLKAKLFEYKMGRDSDGDDVTTLVIDRIEDASNSKPVETTPAAKELTKVEKLRRGFIEVFDKNADGKPTELGLDGKTLVRKVPLAEIRDGMKTAGHLPTDDKGNIPREWINKLHDAKTSLTMSGKKQTLVEKDGMVWRIYGEKG